LVSKKELEQMEIEFNLYICLQTTKATAAIWFGYFTGIPYLHTTAKFMLNFVNLTLHQMRVAERY
jgi:hypothetical protein